MIYAILELQISYRA